MRNAKTGRGSTGVRQGASSEEAAPSSRAGGRFYSGKPLINDTEGCDLCAKRHHQIQETRAKRVDGPCLQNLLTHNPPVYRASFFVGSVWLIPIISSP
jgi:hypothetical protein